MAQSPRKDMLRQTNDLKNQKDLELVHSILFSDGNEELNAEEFDESDADEEDILETREVDCHGSKSVYNDSELDDDVNNDYFYVSYRGSTRDVKIYLYLHNSHFDLIKSPRGFFGSDYFCDSCLKPYQSLALHRCEFLCHVCRRSNCTKESDAVRCTACDRLCSSSACYSTHIERGICALIYQCRKCSKVIERKKCLQDLHKCGEIRCKNCKKYFPPGHLCFLGKLEAKKHSDKLMFYDFETTQETREHFVNFAIIQYADGTERVFRGQDTLSEFCCYVLDPKHKDYTLNAHNMKGFDGQFVLRWLLERGYQPKVIPQGSKILQILVTAVSIRFIDSFCFLPMALSKLPKTFGIAELTKGFFPHFFNVPANQNYIAPMPDMSFYSPDTMSTESRQKFVMWYEDYKDDVFDFKKEMEKYCRYVSNL
ncbi:uncharacterized protein [Parasteatoda tepidariorum]|uniref:uncharacterized protein n=1 Tax=Parasteatoda tepidariorum TaxID=114398 RepID=UPI0039BD5BC8